LDDVVEQTTHRLGEQIYFLRAFMVFMTIHFLFNFLGSPMTLYSGAVLAVVSFLAVIFLRWDQAFFIVILYSLVAGQIKVIWGYNPFFRLISDFQIVVLVFRSFAKTGRIINFHRTPNFFIWMLLGHFLWFVVCLFNPLGAGFVPSFAAGKFYILPIFYFFTILNFELDPTSRLFKDFLKTFMFFIVLEALLAIFQSTQGTEFMYSISNNYATLFEKYKNFSSVQHFRPWGTTDQPGGYASHFYLSSAFIFLWSVQPGGDEAQRLSTPKKLFIFSFTVLSLFAVLISQVRSSFFKEIFVISIGLFFSILGTRFVAKRIIGIAVGIAAFVILGAYGLNQSKGLSEYMTVEKVVARYEAVNSLDKAASRRASFSAGLGAIGRRLENPLGLGLGMATNYLEAYGQRRKESVDVDQNLYWTMDNFFAHVATEMGLGSLFIISTVIVTPFILASLMITALRRKNFMVYRIVCYCFVMVTATTLGQWGAIGILFPPEFQFYWLYLAIAFTSFYKAYPKKITLQQNA